MALDHGDRHRLSEIEQRLALDDPGFAARMRTRTGKQPFPTVSVLCAVFYIFTPIVMLLGGPRAGLIMTATFLVSIAVILGRRRCR